MMERKHSKTIKDVVEIFEPYLTVNDVLEAIEELKLAKGIIEQDGKDYLDERDIPVLDTAIKALEKQTNVKDKQAHDEKSK